MPEPTATTQRHCPICGQTTSAALCPTDGAETLVVGGFTKNALSFQPGEVVGGTRYLITGTLGKGGFGAVYAAEHTGTRQAIALKMLTVDPTTAEDDVVRRFFREAQITARLQSRHTVQVFDVGQAENGPLFLGMEHLRGPTLEKILRKRRKAGQPMAEAQAIDVAIPILKSLGEAHKLGLVHRDLKPANVMLADMGEEEPVVKVLDFGIARTEDSSLTGAGKALGTPAYMSPEQCGGKPLDGRSDIYSLGVIVYRCVVGKAPFENANTLSLMFMHAKEPVPDPRKETDNPLSDEFLAWLLKTLSKDREERFADAREARLALEGIRGGAWGGTPSSPHDVTDGLEGDLDDNQPTLLTPAVGMVKAAVDGPPSSGLLDLVMDDADYGEEPSRDSAPTRALDSASLPTAGAAALHGGATLADANPLSAEVSTPGGKGKWLALVALLVVIAVGAGYAILGDETTSPAPGVADEAAPARQEAPAAETTPKASAAAAVKSKSAVRAAAVAATARIEAKAKAQMAAAAPKLAAKVRYMKAAIALDPGNSEYPILLQVFEKGLAEQRAEAEEAAAAVVPVAAKPAAPKPAGPKPVVRKPSTPKPTVRKAPAAKEKESGSDDFFVPAID